MEFSIFHVTREKPQMMAFFFNKSLDWRFVLRFIDDHYDDYDRLGMNIGWNNDAIDNILLKGVIYEKKYEKNMKKRENVCGHNL